MKKILISYLLLSFSAFAADDCGVNIYNIATGKIHKRFLAANQVHFKNKKVISKRCETIVEKNSFDENSFNIIANCKFETGDKRFNPSTNDYENVDADDWGWLIATYSYNMFAYEITCSNN